MVKITVGWSGKLKSSEADIIKLEIGTGEPIVYKFTDGKFIKESHR